MDGQIPELWIPQFLPKLTEGSVYYIKYFQVRAARDLYRPVDHPYLMRFTAHTKLHEINPAPPQFPQYAYNLATFEVLNTRMNETKFCSGMDSHFIIRLQLGSVLIYYKYHTYSLHSQSCEPYYVHRCYWCSQRLLTYKTSEHTKGNQVPSKCWDL